MYRFSESMPFIVHAPRFSDRAEKRFVWLKSHFKAHWFYQHESRCNCEHNWATNEGATPASIVPFVPSNIHTGSKTVSLLSRQADWWGLHPEFQIFNGHSPFLVRCIVTSLVLLIVIWFYHTLHMKATLKGTAHNLHWVAGVESSTRQSPVRHLFV